MFMDLDRFKSINDTHGHLIGSRLLAEVGGLLKRTIGPKNSGFRYGGDEFVALFPGLNKAAGIDATISVYEKLREARFLEGRGPLAQPLGKFWVGNLPEDGNTVPTILRSADTMMYEAKTTRDNIAVAGRGLLLEARCYAGSRKETVSSNPAASWPACVPGRRGAWVQA